MGAATAIHVGRGVMIGVPELVALIAARPAGARLDIAALARALAPTQAEVIDAVQAAIAEGALDPKTLRPSTKVTKLPPAKEFRPTGADLGAQIEAEAMRRVLSKADACLQIFGNKQALWALRKGVRPVSRKMYAKVQAWLESSRLAPSRSSSAGETGPDAGVDPAKTERAEPNSPSPAPTEQGSAAALPKESGSAPAKSAEASSESPPPPASGAHLLSEIVAFCARSGMSHTKFGLRAKGDPNYVRRLRTGTQPTPRSVEQIRAFIGDWAPEDDTRESAAARRRPAQGRNEVAVRRSITKQAEKFLDGQSNGKTRGGAPNQAVLAVARQIEDKRAAENRQTDPVERAKLALQRKGRVVYSAVVNGGRKDRFIVGGQRDGVTGQLKEHTPAELIDLAEKVTGESFREGREYQPRRVA